MELFECACVHPNPNFHWVTYPAMDGTWEGKTSSESIYVWHIARLFKVECLQWDVVLQIKESLNCLVLKLSFSSQFCGT